MKQSHLMFLCSAAFALCISQCEGSSQTSLPDLPPSNESDIVCMHKPGTKPRKKNVSFRLANGEVYNQEMKSFRLAADLKYVEEMHDQKKMNSQSGGYKFTGNEHLYDAPKGIHERVSKEKALRWLEETIDKLRELLDTGYFAKWNMREHPDKLKIFQTRIKQFNRFRFKIKREDLQKSPAKVLQKLEKLHKKYTKKLNQAKNNQAIMKDIKMRFPLADNMMGECSTTKPCLDSKVLDKKGWIMDYAWYCRKCEDEGVEIGNHPQSNKCFWCGKERDQKRDRVLPMIQEKLWTCYNRDCKALNHVEQTCCSKCKTEGPACPMAVSSYYCVGFEEGNHEASDTPAKDTPAKLGNFI